ncbi:hypothetical protein Sango_1323200 [Sesamum angolense]|uniref:Uncharacterized protein n=1 Tax=Sesamum angolense TaxID=2727404 RepID=A0AAE2BUP6_9LAMI|nr:hypothetical protein Sango_1323200 [Sesamum angolense]
MVGVGHHLLSLYSSSQASRIKRLTATATLPISICRRYSEAKQESIHTAGHGGVDQERAPSTAEEFKRVAEEKACQGFASQTVEKAQDGAEEAVVGDDSTFESVKEAYKESPSAAGDFRKTGDEG